MRLTPKERITLLYVALGYSDKEICQKMNISYSTVRTYIERGVLKMCARNRTHAALKYITKESPEVYLKTLEGLKEVL